MEVKKEKLQALYEILTNYPAVSKEQVIHEFSKAFGEEVFKPKEYEEDTEDSEAEKELIDIKKNINDWYKKDKENRCTFCIIADMGKGDDDSIEMYTSLLGSSLNIKIAIANAFNDSPKMPLLVNDAVMALATQLAENLLDKEKEDE